MSEPTDPQVPASPPPPPPPPEDPPAAARGNLWERRNEVGFVEGLVGGVKSFITAPGDAFSQTLKSGDLGSPLLYAVLISFVTAVIGQIWAMFFGTSIIAFLPPDAREALPFWVGAQGAGMMVGLVVIPIVTVIWVFLWGAIMHVILMLVGGSETADASFETTLRVVAYSSTGNIAKVVPVIGDIISTLWMIVLAVIGLTRMHGTSEGKSVLIVLLPLVACCVCFGGFVIMGAGAMMSGLAGMAMALLGG